MHELNVLLATMGLAITLIGASSKVLKTRLYLSIPIVALAFGILLGPAGFHFIAPETWPNRHLILEELARITLGIALVSVALRIPRDFMQRYWRSVLWIVFLMMPFMYLASGAMAYLILGQSFWVAMAIGGALTPTDPVVASAIVTGKLADENIPGRLRHYLSTESGSNDGLAYALVMLPLLLLKHPAGDAISQWIYRVVLWEVGIASLLGFAIGYASGKILQLAEKRNWMENTYFFGYSVVLSLISLGAAKLIHSDGIFAVFVAGIVFDWVVGGKERARQDNFQEAINHYFTIPVFVVLGLMLPWKKWAELGAAGLWLCIAVLLLRRPPGLLVFSSFFNPLTGMREKLFIGWFGPLGISSLYYTTLIFRKTGNETVFAAGTLVICASLLAHGLSATPLTRLFGEKQG